MPWLGTELSWWERRVNWPRDKSQYSRRQMLTLSLASLLPGYLVQERQVQADPDSLGRGRGRGRLARPDLAGRLRTRVTDYENDPFIVGVEGKLRCTCGCNLSVYTCRTTDFTCTVSPAMHREVIALAEQDKTGQEILDAFVAQYGEIVLMAPLKEGFNIAAYVVPGIAISTAAAVILGVLYRRTSRFASAARGDFPDLDPEDTSKLAAELGDLER